MPLIPGTRIGVYDITAQIGVGGMGEVYRATDRNLKRSVAIKVLPALVAGDADRLARFQREAEVLAALNHPNIAAIYGLEKTPDFTALVMELVEGEDLSQRIARGAILLDEALPIAKQIADALEAAHEQGIIHRDLKPANIKVRADGTVKVLDFGLAKAMDPAGSSTSVSMSPTLTTPAMVTGVGVILGTAVYMSPEQARGKAVDKRADIWAFGCVLYEMVTGRRPFGGDDVGETLAAVIKEQPPMDVVPGEIRPLVKSCLEKDPKKRLRDLGDAWRIVAPRQQVARALPSVSKSRWPWAIAAASLAVAGALVVVRAPWTSAPPSVAAPAVRLDADVGVEVSRGAGQGPPLAISPDGSRLAIITPGADGKDHLALRLLGSSQANVLAGTEDAASPFFSPDSRSIAFFAGGKLEKMSVEGGSPVVICDAKNPRGGSWGEDGNIIFASENRVPLSRVSAAGGDVTPATQLDVKAGEVTNRYAQVLPGAQAFLFQSRTDNDPYVIQAQSIRTGQRTILVKNGYNGHYVPSGHLLFMREGALYSIATDLKRLEVTGRATPVVQDLRDFSGNGWAYFDVSRSGTLVYLPADASSDRTVAWLDASGHLQRLPLPPGPYVEIRASPDATRLAVVAQEGTDTTFSMYDLTHDRLTRVATVPGRVGNLTWMPDGKHLVYSFARGSGDGIFWMRADGAGTPEVLVDGAGWEVGSAAPDGKRIGYWHAQKEYGLWTIALDLSDPDHPKPGKPEPFVQSNAEVRGPAFSPDGRWGSYSSMESGRQEMYVRPFPGPGGKWQISRSGAGGGGALSTWRSGNRLYYLTGDRRLHVVDYRAEGSSFSAGLPRDWSSAPIPSAGDLSADGSRVFVLTTVEGSGPKPLTQVTFVLNFFDRLRGTIAPNAQ